MAVAGFPDCAARRFEGAYAAEVDHFRFTSKHWRPTTTTFWIPDRFFGGPGNTLDLSAVGHALVAGETLFVNLYLTGSRPSLAPASTPLHAMPPSSRDAKQTRAEHVRRQALRRRPVRQLAVVEREDLPARSLHPLDHLQLNFERAHQPIEIRHHQLIGPASLDHLDRRQQARALGQRQPAAHVDLGNRRGNKPLTAVLRTPPGGLDLHLGGVKVLVLPVALLAHADDHDISDLSFDMRPLSTETNAL